MFAREYGATLSTKIESDLIILKPSVLSLSFSYLFNPCKFVIKAFPMNYEYSQCMLN